MDFHNEIGQERLPASYEVELSLIALALYEPGETEMICAKLNEADFHYPENRLVFTTMQKMVNDDKNLDVLLLTARLKSDGNYEKIGGHEYFQKIAVALEAGDVNELIKVLKDKKAARDVCLLFNTTRNNILRGEDFKASLQEFDIKYIDFIKERKASQMNQIAKFTPETMDLINRNVQKKGELMGITTGFPQLNEIIDGFQPGNLIILAALTGVGKTALALQFAVNAAQSSDKAKVAFFSLEMNSNQIILRVLSRLANVPHSKIMKGDLNAEDIAKITTARSTLDRLPIFLDENINSVFGDIYSICRGLSTEGNLDLVVVDYIQLVDSGDKANQASRVREVGAVSRGLKKMALSLGVPVIALAQLSRQAAQTDKDTKTVQEPQLHHLRESGSLEQDADIVMFLHRNLPSGVTPAQAARRKQRTHAIKLIVAKNRHGSLGEVDLLYNGQVFNFEEKVGAKTDQGAEADE